jgi:hypothetical protein
MEGVCGRLVSDTARICFSYTFHSLIVLSVNKSAQFQEYVHPFANHWLKAGSVRRFGACTT